MSGEVPALKQTGRQVVVGIDEAGYGPTLGPMVVTSAAFAVPDNWRPGDLWGLLAPAVHRPGTDRVPQGKPLLGDSKMVYSSKAGLSRLESSVLAFLKLADVPRATLLQALPHVLVGPADLVLQMQKYPWYDGQDIALPLAAPYETPDAFAELLRSVLADASVGFLGFRCAPLMVSQYNVLVGQTDNKAEVLFNQAAQLMEWAMRSLDADRVHILVDKQGGRNCYEDLLACQFDGALISTLKQGPEQSTYLLRRGRQSVTVSFTMKGDIHYLPIALASMFSKYFRELFMTMFNAFWTQRIPDLKPTSGYPVDARRFIAQTASVREQMGIDPCRLIRSR